ncbi:fused MFS/spermidine synthase [Gimesia chilikensis]|uniref:Spermidine synthase n=1 Tax=Gimesia chilikensis TaxID=2605989 RepID=A0A517PJR3_9PLAN|nr:fused MFS/spermidine synthase [Gimesia chilikensis]QDT19628.1 spermidine synthase [Gimesia chilikensis]
MSGTPSERSASTLKLATLLFFSGACALIYQVIWIRELRLIFGATTLASSAVLAIFMGGLGLGNALLGKRSDQFTRPVRFYALLELAIAVSVALSPFLIDLTRYAYVRAGGQSTMGVEVATIVRLLAATAILILPTIFMGGTLPAAARAVTSQLDAKRRNLACIYGINTLGAVLGAGLANFMLLELLGNRVLLWLACLVNLLLAAISFWYSWQLVAGNQQQAADTSVSPQIMTESEAAVQRTRPHAVLLYFTAAVVGFVFFQMEIVWYRMLGPLLGGTTYTFGLILCIVLLGIGIGGLLYHLIGRWITPSYQLLVTTCTLEAICIAVPFWLGDRIAMWVLQQQQSAFSSFAEQVWSWFEVGSLVVLPVALVSGFQFPVLIALAGSGQQDVGKHVGWTFAANTCGAICGAIAGGFFLLPALNAIGVWRLSVLMLLVLGLTIVCVSRLWQVSRFGISLASSLALLALLGVVQQGPTAAWRHSGIGAGRAELEDGSRNAEQNFINTKRRQLLWETEGVESSIGITATDSLSFIVNGKSDGNAYTDAGTQMGLGLLGPVLKSDLKTGLVIGLGTGETVGWLADAISGPVDVVELEPGVLDMARRCESMNRRVLSQPDVHIYHNDAREFLLTSAAEYDIIISEPSNPYRAGIANLYTREFYASAADRLAEEGLFLQWLQGYEVDDQTVATVLKTMRSVFPTVEIWRTRARDMVLVCSPAPRPLDYDVDSLQQSLNNPVIREGLKLAWRAKDVSGILAHYVCDNQTIQLFLDQNPSLINTDDRNLLEYAFASSVGRVSRFSTQRLQELAVQSGDTRPREASSTTPEAIARRRLAMHFHLGGAMPELAQASRIEQGIGLAYQFYLDQNYRQAAELFGEVGVDENCPVERVVYAHACAEAGVPISADLSDKLKTGNAAEQAAVQAIAFLKQGDRAEGSTTLLQAFTLMKSNPWGLERIYDSLLRHALALATSDNRLAGPIFENISEPFAMYRLEDKRKLVRFLVAEIMGTKQIAESLEEIEPNVPWKDWLLRKRQSVYRELNHDLSEKAQADLQQFLGWATSP